METYVVGGLAKVTESRNGHGERAVDVVGELLGRAHWLLQSPKEKRDVSFGDPIWLLQCSSALRASREIRTGISELNGGMEPIVAYVYGIRGREM